MNIYIYIYIYIYISRVNAAELRRGAVVQVCGYIDIDRDRDGGRDIDLYIIYIYLYMAAELRRGDVVQVCGGLYI